MGGLLMKFKLTDYNEYKNDVNKKKEYNNQINKNQLDWNDHCELLNGYVPDDSDFSIDFYLHAVLDDLTLF